MTTLNTTLDSILRKHFHANTPPNEKEVCLNVFNRKCKNNNINAEQYIADYKRREGKSFTQSRAQRYETGWTSDWSWDDIFREPKQWKNSQRSEPKGPQPGTYEYECTRDFCKSHGELKDCIYEVKMDRIIIQGLIKVGDRWAIENFVFYTGNDPKKTIQQIRKYDILKFVSNGTRYAGNLNINKLWGVDLNMKEHDIY